MFKFLNKTAMLLMFSIVLIHSSENISLAGDLGPEKLSFVEKWAILLDYDSSRAAVDEEDLLKYDMVILDPDSHPPIENIKDKVTLLAYVSLGEAESYRAYWDKIKDKDWVIGENPDWEGNFYVDVRSEEWRDIIIKEVIPALVKEGFKGVFIDTLDTAIMLEAESPSKYAGANGAMIDFVKEIHMNFQDLYLLSNNGFLILGGIAPFLSGALAEDVNMMIDFENNGYKKVPRDESEYKIRALNLVRDNFSLPIFVIDYAPSQDIDTISECVKKMKSLGFKPYVAEKDLNVIYENPDD